MRPLSLSMSAFGPFATTQTIDFTALGHNPLFLINGPTGAGKTTLLDGICFALYGKTTGNEREGSQMRCDMADDNVLTEVVFSFQLGAASYRIRRIPEQERSKKSGEGSTLQKSEAQLYRIDAEGAEQLLVATKVSEATSAIEALTGLDVEQFRQVMVLPQGKFRELLMADSKAREQIFSQLFQTHIYRRIEDKLKDQAGQIRALVKEQRARRDGILQSAELQSDEELQTQLAALAPELNLALQAKEQAAWQQQQAHKAYDAAQHLQGEFALLEALRQSLTALESQSSSMAAKTAELNLAKQAERLGPVVEHLTARKSEAMAANLKLNHASETLSASLQAHEAAELKAKDIPALEARLLAQEGQKSQLSELGPRLLELEGVSQRLIKEQAELLKLNAQGEQDKAALKALAQQRKEGEQTLLKLQAMSDTRLALQRAHQQQQQLLSAYEQWQQQLAKVEATKTTLAEAANLGQHLKLQHQEAQRTYQALMLAWHQGQAALLAQGLQQGAPCPVCGSHSHPQPAQSQQPLPSEEALQFAQEAQNRAQEQLSSARAEYRALQSQLAMLQQQADESALALGEAANLPLAAHQQAQSQGREALKAAEQAYQDLVQLQGDMAKVQQQVEARQGQLDSLQLQISQLQASVAVLGSQLTQLQQSVPQSLSSLAALNGALAENEAHLVKTKEQIASLRRQGQQAAEAFTSAKAALEAACASKEAADTQVSRAQQQLDTQLAGAGFADQDSLINAMRAQADMLQLASAITDYEQQRALTHAQS
ncbi:MAG: AAA family ATPase, partial [Shewanella sp.]